MTVRITLEYGSVEEAIVALGRLAQVAKVRRAAQGTGGAPSAPETAAGIAQAPVTATPPTSVVQNLVLPDTRRTRKGRSDKGKPRGPHKEAAAPAEQERTDKAATLPPQEAPAGADKAHPSGEGPPAAAAPTEVLPPVVMAPTEADAKAALEAYFEKNGPQKAMKLLSDFGVQRLRDLPEGDRARFIEACK